MKNPASFFVSGLTIRCQTIFLKKGIYADSQAEKTDWQIIENICECFLAELISNFMIYNKYNLIFNQL